MRQKYIIVDGLNVGYYQSDALDIDGSIVFLHGWGASAPIFKSLLEQCADYIALDLPGFGKSERPKNTWDILAYANFIDKFLRKLNIKNPTLIGHSFGGSVIVKYLSAHGNNAKKIILIDSAGIREKVISKTVLKVFSKIGKSGLIFFPKTFREKTKKSFYKLIDAEDYPQSGAMKEIYLKIISEDLKRDMEKIEVETVLIWGEKDKDTPLSDGLTMKSLIKNSKLFVIKNAGHYSFLENPKEFNSIFLRELC
ncbi:MAG: alpha/beta hydrolase [bacterium]|nr:alpha/beta hydrolase [bacterium]